MISRLAKIPNLYPDCMRPLNNEIMSCIEEKGGLKDIHSIAQNVALFVALLQNIFYLDSVGFYLYR